MSNEIKKLFENTKNSSSKWEKYFDIYENIFSKYKDKDITFVEIGVHNGGSLGIWRQYFSKNSKIIGIDINNECKKFEDKENNIEIFIGNQSVAYPIAEALKVPRILEACPYFPVVQPVGDDAFDFYYQPHFEKWCNYLNNKYK